MNRARRCTRLALAALLTLALLTPAALTAAAPPVAQDGAAEGSWWSWITEPVAQVVGALGPGWEPQGLSGDDPEATLDGGETTTSTEDPDLDTGGDLGPGWEPQG